MPFSHAKVVEKSNGEASLELQTLVRQNYHGIIASQLAEDCFNIQKNHKHIKGQKKWKRPEKTMGAVLAREVLGRVHDYRPPPLDIPLNARSQRLSKSTFVVDPYQASMNLSGINGTQSNTSWYSPAGDQWCQRDGDLAALQECCLQNSWARLGFLWFGQLCKRSHKLLLRKQDGSWYFAKCCWVDSVVIGLRAIRGLLPNTQTACWEPLDNAEYELLPL